MHEDDAMEMHFRQCYITLREVGKSEVQSDREKVQQKDQKIGRNELGTCRVLLSRLSYVFFVFFLFFSCCF